jgi:hypothetical protein
LIVADETAGKRLFFMCGSRCDANYGSEPDQALASA